MAGPPLSPSSTSASCSWHWRPAQLRVHKSATAIRHTLQMQACMKHLCILTSSSLAPTVTNSNLLTASATCTYEHHRTNSAVLCSIAKRAHVHVLRHTTVPAQRPWCRAQPGRARHPGAAASPSIFGHGAPTPLACGIRCDPAPRSPIGCSYCLKSGRWSPFLWCMMHHTLAAMPRSGMP